MAPFVSRLLPLFPPVVTGTIITVIGISLVGVGINWAAGGVGNPQYGRPLYLGIAFFVLLSILLITRFGRGFVLPQYLCSAWSDHRYDRRRPSRSG